MRKMSLPLLDDLTSLEFWQLATHNVADIIKSMAIETTQKASKSGHIRTTMYTDPSGLKNDSKHEVLVPLDPEDWKILAWPSLGFCFSYKIPEKMVQRGIYAIVFHLKIDAYIYTHQNGHFYSTVENKIVSETGQKVYVSLTYDYSQLLPILDCTDDLKYSHDECILEKFGKEMIKKFGCDFITTSNTPENICNGRNIKEEFMEDFGDEYEQLYKEVKHSYCPMPCGTMNVHYGIPAGTGYELKNVGYTKIYFKQRVIARKSVYTYTTQSVIADIGGFLGLMLGFSILDLSFVIENVLTFFRAKTK